jgi:hypothetical protein
MSGDLESEMLDLQLRAARRAQEVVRPCEHCFAVPTAIAWDEYGYPRAAEWPLVLGCPIHNPDWPV